ncbi:MAG: endonuclease/exonuclease/phosphatase family protein [Candidatus Devosia phytovorans]|uniref:Endonuclease/exonuclease/phosphatase family protein n=1 Tax=Candidatus Devosia phytovorans TaxID=3121372 RepID=A0AAJ6AZW8_9HYPH|nr:endonuclease/exonuclease/phosphatase family protein [Devosia sp.]WEK05030.1 MAG: endonuclease/exonuclease/phosphatase family protein [Devosia sp.]
MRIVSLNTWSGRLHAEVLSYLAGIGADILCLQEVSRTPDTPDDWLIYREPGLELPQRANFFDELASALPDHDGFFLPTASGPLFHGEIPIPSQFGLATFVRKSLPVIAQHAGFVHGHYSPDGWGEHPRARNAHALRIATPDGKTITVAQMHGLRELTGKGDSPARAAQAEAFVDIIHKGWPGDEPLIVCGDFNVLPDSVTFATLGKLGLTDLVTGRGHTDTRTSWYEKPGRYADYLLTTPDVEIIAFDAVASPEVSDHRALLLDMR